MDEQRIALKANRDDYPPPSSVPHENIQSAQTLFLSTELARVVDARVDRDRDFRVG